MKIRVRNYFSFFFGSHINEGKKMEQQTFICTYCLLSVSLKCYFWIVLLRTLQQFYCFLIYIIQQTKQLFLFLVITLLSNRIFRGPANGSRGKVVLLFDDNPLSKIGVRFDKPIPDGVDLGGLCEPGQGFFCNGNALSV